VLAQIDANSVKVDNTRDRAQAVGSAYQGLLDAVFLENGHSVSQYSLQVARTFKCMFGFNPNYQIFTLLKPGRPEVAGLIDARLYGARGTEGLCRLVRPHTLVGICANIPVGTLGAINGDIINTAAFTKLGERGVALYLEPSMSTEVTLCLKVSQWAFAALGIAFSCGQVILEACEAQMSQGQGNEWGAWVRVPTPSTAEGHLCVDHLWWIDVTRSVRRQYRVRIMLAQLNSYVKMQFWNNGNVTGRRLDKLGGQPFGGVETGVLSSQLVASIFNNPGSLPVGNQLPRNNLLDSKTAIARSQAILAAHGVTVEEFYQAAGAGVRVGSELNGASSVLASSTQQHHGDASTNSNVTSSTNDGPFGNARGRVVTAQDYEPRATRQRTTAATSATQAVVAAPASTEEDQQTQG